MADQQAESFSFIFLACERQVEPILVNQTNGTNESLTASHRT